MKWRHTGLFDMSEMKETVWRYLQAHFKFWKMNAFGVQTYRPCCYVLHVVLRVPLVLWIPDLLLSLVPGGSDLLGVGLLSWSHRPSNCRCPPHGPVDRVGDPSCAGRQGWRVVGHGRVEEVVEDGWNVVQGACWEGNHHSWASACCSCCSCSCRGHDQADRCSLRIERNRTLSMLFNHHAIFPQHSSVVTVN